MATYHLNANVISRARGQSIVAAAAYRAGARLRDERYGRVHNYAARRSCVHAEIMAPDTAPEWARDRELLWNRVEAAERRKDSQLARVIEVALPVELTPPEALLLVRDYVGRVFVAKGMIADFYIRRDNPGNPHAHILLTLRRVTPQGFGPKERRWNGKANLLEWRSAWAERSNWHLCRAGHAVRIDHRTLEAQQIELTPARRTGIGRAMVFLEALPEHLLERIDEQRLIAQANGETILQDPTVALRALTHHSPSFSEQDLERFLRSRTADDVQFTEALAAVRQSADLVLLPAAAGRAGAAGVFTSRDMLEAWKSLRRRIASMAERRGHAITPHTREAVLARVPMEETTARTFELLVGDGAVKAARVDSLERAQLLEALLAAWTADALRVVRTTPLALDAIEAGWRQEHEPLTADIVLLVEDADPIGLKQLERVLAAVGRARAKLVLVGAAIAPGTPDGETPFCCVMQSTWSVMQANEE
jgi:hypothetical protein